MTLCPIAVVAGCKKCPAFGICPLRSVIGDHKPEDAHNKEAKAPDKAAKKSGK